MPHLITKKHDTIKTPSSKDGVFFDFIATSHKNENIQEEKICVTAEGKRFFLTKLEKNGNDLIKLDVTTRVTPISIAKKALKAYGELANCEIISSNIASSTTKIDPKKEYLKEISYFVDDFSTQKEICIEVGFGSGRHLLYQAKTNKNKLYIGLEIHTPSIEQVLKQIRIDDISNILVVNYDARLFLEFMASNSISQIFVHFPVPWDKKPHRRVMSKEFIDEALRVLNINGSLELRTDSPLYYEYSKELYETYTEKSTITKNQDLEISSKYEDRWKRMGKDIWDLTIYADKMSPEISIDKDFVFDIKNILSFDEITKKLPKKPIVEDGFMVHFSHPFKIEESSGLIHASMGSFNKPFSIYIFIDKEKISYFISLPVPTSSNHKAHKLIEQILKNEDSK
ncbi:MAG: tRNA (guanosine(46)-N7)-methyltransferase TrmB [Arcobacter sp.]|nr:tRNA (guanosine(46)-N7)-methyltransferase TrmB [Arcobacter sp.]